MNSKAGVIIYKNLELEYTADFDGDSVDNVYLYQADTGMETDVYDVFTIEAQNEIEEMIMQDFL